MYPHSHVLTQTYAHPFPIRSADPVACTEISNTKTWNSTATLSCTNAFMYYNDCECMCGAAVGWGEDNSGTGVYIFAALA